MDEHVTVGCADSDPLSKTPYGSGTASVSRTRRLWARAAFLAVLWSFWPAFLHAAANLEIAILNSSENAAYQEAITGFKATGPGGVIYTQYDLQGDLELGKKLARKVRASDASLVVAVGLKAALAAKWEIADVPVVYMMILDPLKHQLNAPNMTGTLLEIPVDRQLKLIRTLLPTVRRLGTLYDPKKSAQKIREAEQHAAVIGLEFKGFPVDSDRDVPSQLRALLGAADALWLLPDSTVLNSESIDFLLQSALAQRVPVIGFSPEFTRLGALVGLSVNYGEVGRETGVLARRVLDGEKVNPLKPVPIERLKITVNLKTARFLGLSFSQELNGLIDETY